MALRSQLPALPCCRNLRILAAGGDGTVTWILKTIRDLQLEPPPAVAILPLGTGNDMSLSFGWGEVFLDRWVAAPQLYTTLKRFADARLHHLDCWGVSITAPDASFFHELPYALQQAAPDKVGCGWGWVGGWVGGWVHAWVCVCLDKGQVGVGGTGHGMAGGQACRWQGQP